MNEKITWDRKIFHIFLDAVGLLFTPHNDFLLNVYFEVQASLFCCKSFKAGVATKYEKTSYLQKF
jgi:hypothetical protein